MGLSVLRRHAAVARHVRVSRGRLARRSRARSARSSHRQQPAAATRAPALLPTCQQRVHPAAVSWRTRACAIVQVCLLAGVHQRLHWIYPLTHAGAARSQQPRPGARSRPMLTLVPACLPACVPACCSASQWTAVVRGAPLRPGLTLQRARGGLQAASLSASGERRAAAPRGSGQHAVGQQRTRVRQQAAAARVVHDAGGICCGRQQLPRGAMPAQRCCTRVFASRRARARPACNTMRAQPTRRRARAGRPRPTPPACPSARRVTRSSRCAGCLP